MKLAIMQPYFFPYIGYFQLITAVDLFILYSNLNYIKEGWMHRNRIISNKKDIVYINLDLQQKSSNLKIYDIKLCKSKHWREKLLKTLYHSYVNTKYYQEVFPIIRNLINQNQEYLHDLNSSIIEQLCGFIGITTRITTDYKKYYSIEDQIYEISKSQVDDRINRYGYNVDKKTARVLEFCFLHRADCFINPIGGVNLYSKDVFKRNGIDLYFLKTNTIKYRQFSLEFIPDLSIIDVLMHCGPQKTLQLLKEYTLI